MGRLLKFWSLPRREKQFLFEAGTLLLLSKLCVKTIAFRYIDSFLCGRWKNGDDLGRADDIKLIELSLSRAARLLPENTLCLSRSIAAFIMLRRRGIPAEIVAGVKFAADTSLIAHAWVQTGRDPINAKTENSAFAAVVRIGQEPAIADSAPNRL